MFITYDRFKFPIKLGPESTMWSLVEIMGRWPWLMVTTKDDAEQVQRTYLLQGTDALLQLIDAPGSGKLQAVCLALPPYRSPTKDWAFVPICRVERELQSVNGTALSSVIASVDGQRYAGDPIVAVYRQAEDLVVVAELGTLAS